MRVYDFDETIFYGDSEYRFFYYCFLRLPYLWLLYPIMLLISLLSFIKILPKKNASLILASYIFLVPNKKHFINKFWDKNISRIKPFYLKQKQDDDLIISATPIYNVGEACKRLNVKCIASSNKYRVYGNNKVIEFKKLYPDYIPDEFYSDSKSDYPMMKYAKKGYLVEDDKITLLFVNGEKII